MIFAAIRGSPHAGRPARSISTACFHFADPKRLPFENHHAAWRQPRRRRGGGPLAIRISLRIDTSRRRRHPASVHDDVENTPNCWNFTRSSCAPRRDADADCPASFPWRAKVELKGPVTIDFDANPHVCSPGRGARGRPARVARLRGSGTVHLGDDASRSTGLKAEISPQSRCRGAGLSFRDRGGTGAARCGRSQRRRARFRIAASRSPASRACSPLLGHVARPAKSALPSNIAQRHLPCVLKARKAQGHAGPRPYGAENSTAVESATRRRFASTPAGPRQNAAEPCAARSPVRWQRRALYTAQPCWPTVSCPRAAERSRKYGDRVRAAQGRSRQARLGAAGPPFRRRRTPRSSSSTARSRASTSISSPGNRRHNPIPWMPPCTATDPPRCGDARALGRHCRARCACRRRMPARARITFVAMAAAKPARVKVDGKFVGRHRGNTAIVTMMPSARARAMCRSAPPNRLRS